LVDFDSTNRATLTGLKEVEAEAEIEIEKRENVGRVGNSTNGFPMNSSFDKLRMTGKLTRSL